jgi:hypothetical protein
MRQLVVAAVSIVAAGLAIVMARRLSRSRNMEHKVEELQEKFRGLDTILPTPAEPHL